MNRRVLDDFCEYLVDLVHARVAPGCVTGCAARRIARRDGLTSRFEAPPTPRDEIDAVGGGHHPKKQAP